MHDNISQSNRKFSKLLSKLELIEIIGKKFEVYKEIQMDIFIQQI